MAGETVNYYYLGHLLLALPAHVLSARRRRGLQPRGRAASSRSRRRRCSRSPGRCGRPRARAARGAARRAGRRRAGGGRAVPRARQPRGRARVAAGRRPAGRLRLVRASRVIPDTINEFPSFSFMLGDLHAHVLAIPFTLLALAFALQVALDGPRGDLALARGRRGAGRGARDRRAVRDQLVVVSGRRRAAGRAPSSSGCAGPRRTGGARSAPSGPCSCSSPGVVLVLPFWLNFDPAARGIGGVDRARARSRAGPATWR